MFDLSNFISPKQIQAMKQEIVEDTLAVSYPIIALEYCNGIIMMGQNPSESLFKTSEIYDRIAFAGTGLFNDYDRLRKAGVHMADIRGFTYSRMDVNARNIASEYSTVLGDIFTKQQLPMEVEIIVVEIGDESNAGNRIYQIPFSGGLVEEKGISVIGDYVIQEKRNAKGLLRRYLKEKYSGSEISLKEATLLIREAIDALKIRGELKLENTELVTLDRTIKSERKFKRFSKEEIVELLS